MRNTKIKHKDGLFFLYICGFVLMPNHVHINIAFKNSSNIFIDSMIVNGKRILAIEIISRLKEKEVAKLLNGLSNLVTISDRKKGKLQEVFEP